MLGVNDWVEAALSALDNGGITAVNVETLARGLGVTKGSFYHHFSRRQDLLDAMQARWIAVGTNRIIEEMKTAADDPVARLTQLIMQVFGEVDTDTDYNARMREWAATDPEVARAVADVDTHRLEFLRGVIVATGVPEKLAKDRAEFLYKAYIGEGTWLRCCGGPRISHTVLQDIIGMVIRVPDCATQA